MKPYYETELGKLYHGDCLEIMPELEPVDLVLTDPPYGEDISYGRKGKSIVGNESLLVNIQALIAYKEIIRENKCIYNFTGWKNSEKLRFFIEMIGLYNVKMLLVMKKNNIGMGGAFRNQHELCWVFENGIPVYNKKNFSNIIEATHVAHDDNSHPHQKPVDVLMKIIEHSSMIDDVVLDSFAGSASTAIACERLNRRWIGIEISEEYCEIAAKRIENERKQLKLF